MPATGRNYIIAGAGISGMTLALALAKFGASVLVLERSPGVQEFGAGLQISPNARLVLNQLGLSDAIDQVSLEPTALDVYPQGGMAPAVSMELGTLMRERFGSPYAVMHRADLAGLLYKACRRFANIDILFGIRGWTVDAQDRGVTVSVEEASGQTRTTRGLAFLGADGVHSQTRQTLLDGPAARFGRRLAWRTLVPAGDVADYLAIDHVSVFFGSGFHLVCYPMPHRGQVNLALFMPGDTPDKPSGQPRPARPGKRAGAIIAAAGNRWTPWPLFTVDTPTWHKGNIGLLGDAAHAMVPFQAQGAAMGIEDAAVLARLLANGAAEDANSALASYVTERQARVRRVAALSASNGRIFHMKWPLSMARNLVMTSQGPRGHLKRLGWIYDYDAGLV